MSVFNPFGHIDLKVNDLKQAIDFYSKLLPELGFTKTYHTEKWKVFASEGELPSGAYFAFTEDPDHQPNGNIIGFWASSPSEVDRIASVVKIIGGKITDGPKHFPISDTYYAFYFEDPFGNRYEVVHRLN